MKKLIVVLAVMAFTLAGCMDACNTAYKEFKPSTLLKKYEWFKDASAQLDKKVADIKVFESRLANMDSTYKGIQKKDWPKDERQTYNQWDNEVAGTIASYNLLAAEYNSQMAKFNWAFCNAGTLPEGATEVLPREYKPYKTK